MASVGRFPTLQIVEEDNQLNVHAEVETREAERHFGHDGSLWAAQEHAPVLMCGGMTQRHMSDVIPPLLC